MINQVDKDGTGSLDFPEFLMMKCLKSDVENAEDEIREAFQVFDGVTRHMIRLTYTVSFIFQDGNGFINRQELACVMGNLGIELSPEDIQVVTLCISFLAKFCMLSWLQITTDFLYLNSLFTYR